jgi:hypothetical protein
MYRSIALSFGAPDDFDARMDEEPYPRLNPPLGEDVDVLGSDEFLEAMTVWIEQNWNGVPFRRGDFVENSTTNAWGYRNCGTYIMDTDNAGRVVVTCMNCEYEYGGAVPLSFHDLPVGFHLTFDEDQGPGIDWYNPHCPIRPANYGGLVAFNDDLSYAVTANMVGDSVGVIFDRSSDPDEPRYGMMSEMPEIEASDDDGYDEYERVKDLLPVLRQQGCQWICVDQALTDE